MNVCFEDDVLLIVSKPAGLPCLPAKGGKTPTLDDLVRARWPMIEPEAGLVHRIDNDTSGLVIVAKTVFMYQKMRALFSRREIEKGYLALVFGNPPAKGEIAIPIAHHPSKRKKMLACPLPTEAARYHARPAKTLFRVVERLTTTALLDVTMWTGVRHQIRVHLSFLGFPIVGDRLYQHTSTRAHNHFAIDRHFLHAHRLSFIHPQTGERIECTCDLPKELEAVRIRRGVPPRT